MKEQVLPTSLFVMLALLSGCSSWGDVPPEMRADSGIEPTHIDEQVRFRTTYYFRVLRGCPLQATDRSSLDAEAIPFVRLAEGNIRPLSDSLYRFRMTGKAAALFNTIHFESGVLRKEQIDPFGSTVRFDSRTNSFIPVPAEEVRSQAKIEAARSDIESIADLAKHLRQEHTSPQASRDSFDAKIREIIENRLEIIKGTALSNGASSSINVSSPSDPSMPQSTTNASNSSSDHGSLPECNGQPTVVKYFLLGPEGTKELDPSDRLLMALSVDSKPLIGMLQQLSAHTFQAPTVQALEGLLNERARILNAHRALRLIREAAQEDKEESSSLSPLAEELRSTFTPSSIATTR